MFKKLIHFLFAWFAYWFYGRPARKLIVVGVTGTKGKSTVCRLIASVLEAGGHKVGLLSTVEFQVAGRRWPNDKKMTMLGRGKIQSLLKQMVKAGCKYAVVETSSEGILQYRHYGLNYQIAVFTNLGAEHSERHGGFENLKRDKAKIFAKAKIIVANTDDANSNYFLSFPAEEKWGFGTKHVESRIANYELIATGIASDSKGVQFMIHNSKFIIHLLGKFNVHNALAAIAVGRSQKISDDKIANGLSSVKLVEGRMELVDEGQNFKVIVDYAHEPMSLSELFASTREMAGQNKKVIATIGSDGGGRDKGKRESMGETAGRLTDYIVITDVNCYDEDPKEIAEMLAKGARAAGKKDGVDLFIIVDRRAAITKAISLAGAGDVVAITAKGTEPYIAVAGGRKIPWDDRKVAREVLEKMQN
jgi:UDP-N-acetylmuramoyl-L-alanyl-D-glutamate--2,6-diaminopimelate ligase